MPALALAAALVTAWPAATSSEPTQLEGRVVRVSPRPNFGSGVFAVWADFELQAASGVRSRVFLPYAGSDQFLPEVGAACRVTVRLGPVAGITSYSDLDPHAFREIATELDCDTGRWITF